MKMCAFDTAFEMQNALLQTEDNIYLLMDGARFENIHAFIYKMEETPEYISLYRGTYYESVLEVSPCLVRPHSSHEGLLSWYIAKGADEHKAILLVSKEDGKTLAEHFREFLEAKLPSMEIVLFRFYDPCILNCMARLQHKPQIKEMFKHCASVCWRYDGIDYALQRDVRLGGQSRV